MQTQRYLTALMSTLQAHLSHHLNRTTVVIRSSIQSLRLMCLACTPRHMTCARIPRRLSRLRGVGRRRRMNKRFDSRMREHRAERTEWERRNSVDRPAPAGTARLAGALRKVVGSATHRRRLARDADWARSQMCARWTRDENRRPPKWTLSGNAS